MKAVLVDDEQIALEVLEVLLKDIDGIEIVGMYTDPEEAYEQVKQTKIDVLFLDMEMGEMHGLQFAEKMMTTSPQVEIVFVTAYPQFAIEAFEVNALDYLLKPVKKERLIKTIDKVRENINLYKKVQKANETKEERLYAQVMGGFRLFDLDKNEVRWRTRKTKELFIYLWNHQNKPIHRTRLIEALWSDVSEDRVSTLMHTTVYQLRRAMKELGYENPVTLVNDQYSLNVQIHSDIEKMLHLIETGEYNREYTEKVMELYEGDFLEGEDYPWALPEQQEIRQLYVKFLEGYVMNKEKDDPLQFVEGCLKQLIALEPYNETYVYMLIDHYGKTSNTLKMATLFDEFKQKWNEELGIDLPEHIIQIYKKYITD